jgi:hypothetical protein
MSADTKTHRMTRLAAEGLEKGRLGALTDGFMVVAVECKSHPLRATS